MEIGFRPYTKEDTNFIYATWLNSYYYGSRFAEHLTKEVYYEYHQEIIRRIIEGHKTDILVACSLDDPNTIFGYMVIEHMTGKPIIHYMYVKGPFQGFGISSKLLSESRLKLSDCYFTHWTRDCSWLIDKYPELVYNPYLIS